MPVPRLDSLSRCQFSPGMGLSVFGYVGPLFNMMLARFQAENRLTIESQLQAEEVARRVVVDPMHKGMALLEAMEAGRL